MDTTKAQQNALDDALVAPENRLMIRKCNQRLSSMLKSNEPTIQVPLDALKLTPFYNAFEVFADVPKIYMQEFWATVTNHHYSLWFKLNEEILLLIRDLGHTSDIKVLSDVNINHMHQPWRSLAAIINKCLSRKTTGLERLCLSRAQLLWGILIMLMLLVKPKPKKKKADSESSPKEKPAQASNGKRLKTSSKAAQSTKEKQPATKSKAKGLTVLFEVALTEDEQMKLATKRSWIQTSPVCHASRQKNV
ncbi:hypothetical protein Tco_0343427 [Tanacetum coccineum]